MKIIATNYNGDCSWIPEYSDGDYFIYDRTGCGLPNSKMVENIGNADYDKLTYIIDNYYDLPDVFLLTKSNLFKYITKEEFDEVKDNKVFTPLLTKNHKTYMPICFYDEQGMYNELNNSWYLETVPSMHYHTYHEFARAFALPNPKYLKFAPGGNYILTRETVQKYGVDFYIDLRNILDYCQLPGEAHFIERSYYNIWS